MLGTSRASALLASGDGVSLEVATPHTSFRSCPAGLTGTSRPAPKTGRHHGMRAMEATTTGRTSGSPRRPVPSARFRTCSSDTNPDRAARPTRLLMSI
jgi:hypothetical protein